MIKVFIIDYYFKNQNDQNKRTYITQGHNRGQVEKRCREMESPSHISIRKIKSCYIKSYDESQTPKT